MLEPQRINLSIGWLSVGYYSHQDGNRLVLFSVAFMQFLYVYEKVLVGSMIYGNVPMMIFILAAGYLLTVYLLLGLAKRTGKKTSQ